MRFEGERFRTERSIYNDRYAVVVEIELVIPDVEPSEPCIEAETVSFLRQVHEELERGNVEWLREHGKVYERLSSSDEPAIVLMA